MHRTRSSGPPPASSASSGGLYNHLVQMHAPPRPPPPPSAPSANAKTQECHICLDDLRTELVACPCGHVYHAECISQALEMNKQCPICRGRATPSQLVRLFLELPEQAAPSSASLIASAQGSAEPQVAALNERVAALIERLQWQKKQYDMLVGEVKRSRHQTEQLLVDKQTLLHRVGGLEANKNELLSKVAKYQIELSRQAEAARQLAVNQSILNYLNSCDADALEDEVQNPRELVAALKKACKFRHDQYQKAIKEKAKLKAMVQSLQEQLGSTGGANGNNYDQDVRLVGKNKMKSPMDAKRTYSSTEYTTPHPHEMKKRKITISPAGVAAHPSHALQPQSSNNASSAKQALSNFGQRGEPSSFRSSAYTDVAVRPMASANMPRSHTGFSRSTFNPNQYGSYNITPSHEPPVQASDQAVCRRGYDETGKLTNYFIPKDTKRPSQSSMHAHTKSVSNVHQFPGSNSSHGGNNRNTMAANAASRSTSADRRDFPLTTWLRKGQ